jgi:hypothetical protein
MATLPSKASNAALLFIFNTPAMMYNFNSFLQHSPSTAHLNRNSFKLDRYAHSLGIDEITPHCTPSTPRNCFSFDGDIVSFVRFVNPMI